MKKIVLLGSTGSIGQQALNIVRQYPDSFRVVGLVCNSDLKNLYKQTAEFKPEAVGLAQANSKLNHRDFAPARVYEGQEAVLRLIQETEADLVLNAIAGSSGLLPSFAALSSNRHLALANKETIVMAGNLLMAEVRHKQLDLIPVDSEHAAIFQLLNGNPACAKERLTEIILTASGGPFRSWPVSQIKKATLKDALRHPNWQMGNKITIDSATMANKALEVIEAYYLFNFPLEKIKILIHPQSYVHSLIRTTDGSLYAQLSKPDMRLPILNALSYPQLMAADFASLDLQNQVLEFYPVDLARYPVLKLGLEAARAGGNYPIVFNAANEIAVEAFLKEEIRFIQISSLIAQTMDVDFPSLPSSLDNVILIDKAARQVAIKHLLKMR